MKIIRLTALALSALLLTPSAFADFYRYQELRLKDLDEMRAMVETKISESSILAKNPASQNSDNEQDMQQAIEKLREALRLILSRPNPDNMVEKLISPVRKELVKYNAFEDSLASLIGSAIHSIKKGKAKVAYRTSDSFVVENFLTEFKPEAKTNEEIGAIYKSIVEAQLKLPSQIISERRKNMYSSFEPSETARRILRENK